MPDSITLTKSGVVLTPWSDAVFCDYRLRDDSHEVMLRHLVGEPSRAWFFEDDFGGSWADCIAWLDSRVLALRAALFPPDARERVAKALAEHCGNESGTVPYPFLNMADAVLSALGIAP